MSTRIVKSVPDCSRHRMDGELACRCGHTACLPYGFVVERWVRKGWPKGIETAWRHFICSRCGARPVRVGPVGR